jgi:hypothetical protein
MYRMNCTPLTRSVKLFPYPHPRPPQRIQPCESLSVATHVHRQLLKRRKAVDKHGVGNGLDDEPSCKYHYEANADVPKDPSRRRGFAGISAGRHVLEARICEGNGGEGDGDVDEVVHNIAEQFGESLKVARFINSVTRN